MDSLLLILFAYLLGSVLFGEHIARAKGVDIRSVGSGNVGATNVGRALGIKYAVLVFLLDTLKGLFPTLLAKLYFGIDSWTLVFVGIASVIGHVFPIFHSFKGGKAVATSLGVLMGLSPLAGIVCLIIWYAVFKLKGYVSLASLTASASAPLLLLIFGYPFKVLLMSFVIVFLVFCRHRDNIARLLEGREHSFKGS
ncbi:MAG: glycerol-3-phosphate 1-O-acyltransferase PlsY [Hydrogenobacter thermophilus]|uniref:glycerol-3-phosphate 1-O-acyltransferase PlsY n=1 Tax=Hydrogenobacter thermophilus TaxID=940 RepID=UPI001C74488C|nr:glycerol-3-phosphate 1-O-acyltransferase PlsY [Hydrogenobacter thermophilus]QWK20639.1 MAG: glycerol-3-phosphate 1-O-acyltransferase PlsY [Hydrogenobacter thermophilus]